ncbi:MAG: peptidoglycan editing factor PgeF [Clostridiales bacterium]|nr:peptidoglycan editing factor PgeF [Clostridiales bacterium]
MRATDLHPVNMRAHWHEGLLFYTFPHLEAPGMLRHAFSGRLGGVSEGCCASLNLAFKHTLDKREHVEENLRRFALAVGFDEKRLVLTRQTHTVNIHEANPEDAGLGITRPVTYSDIDALITAAPQLPLLTYHADCAPLFLYAPRRHMIGLAHAGWRGTAKGMARAITQALAQRGCPPAELLAGIGPSAGPCCYQVGAEVARHFAALSDEAGPVIRIDEAAADKYKLDLWRANRAILLEAGLRAENIVIGGLCTVCAAEIFFSHRRQGEARGTMAAMMMLD